MALSLVSEDLVIFSSGGTAVVVVWGRVFLGYRHFSSGPPQASWWLIFLLSPHGSVIGTSTIIF